MNNIFFLIIPTVVTAILLYLFFGKKKSNTGFILTDEFKHVLNILNNTNNHIFITGKAGTGKSTLLKYFIKNTNKKYVVLAPTGVAALNVGGQTINSFFRFPPSIINTKNINPDYVRAGLFDQLQMVIIDEVSMVRSDMLHGIDVALRRNKNKDEPFGGVQMVFIGDLFQLPPIVKDDEREYIVNKYGGKYFFDAPVFEKLKFHFAELSHIFRQSEDQTNFKRLLNHIRENKISFEDMVLLNSKHIDNAGKLKDSIFLTTKRSIAREINREKLLSLGTEEFIFEGYVTGEYEKKLERDKEELENILPAPYTLKLKKGAQIMMLKNDKAHRWVNGSLGKIVTLAENEIEVLIKGIKHKVEKEHWEETEYVFNNDEIKTKVTSEFVQYPLRLAYAMTIHKSQGKTLDEITIDIGAGTFAPGQMYVALSRAVTFEEVRLNRAVQNKDIFVDPRVVAFYKHKTIPEREEGEDKRTTKELLETAIKDSLKIEMQYQKFNGEISNRILSKIEYSNEFQEHGYNNEHIKAFCHTRNDLRSFKIARIKKINLLN